MDRQTDLRFSITFDYRCPVGFNAHEHVVTALAAGAPWEVTFVPFSLSQSHVEEGEADVWDEPQKDTGLLAMQAGIVARDLFPDTFLHVHRALFAARNVEGRRIADEAVVRDVVATAGLDVDRVFDEIATGTPLATIRKEHTAAVDDFGVWGVPTFLIGDDAVFVRLMSPSGGDADLAVRTIERIVLLASGWDDLNEFKHTRIPR